MSDIKVELDSDGIKELLRSDEVQELCHSYARKAVEQLGEGYESDSCKGEGRSNASVIAVTGEAIAENEKSNTVLKAVLSSR